MSTQDAVEYAEYENDRTSVAARDEYPPIVDRATKQVLASFGRPGRQAGEFTALHNIAVDRQGNIYTSEVNTGQRVQKFRRLDPQN